MVNAPLDYNLLLGCSWFYPMQAVASTVYRLVHFPHQGKIISIDQLDYCTPNVPLVSNSHLVTKLIGARLFKDPCLMGVFPPPVPDAFVTPINMISSVGIFMGDPWILSNPTEVETYGDTMSLSPTERTCSMIQSKYVSAICSPKEDELDQSSLPEWADIPSSSSHDFLSDTLLSNESILEAMMLSEQPWEDNHHQSFILPPLNEEVTPLTSKATNHGPTHSPSTSYGISTEGNLSNILKTITINISVKPRVVETITIEAKCTYEKITLYKALFIEFCDSSPGHMKKCLASTLRS